MYNVLEETRNILIYLERTKKHLKENNKDEIEFNLNMIEERIRCMIDKIKSDYKHEQQRLEYICELLKEDRN